MFHCPTKVDHTRFTAQKVSCASAFLVSTENGMAKMVSLLSQQRTILHDNSFFLGPIHEAHPLAHADHGTGMHFITPGLDM
jgi:hypothetical protein